jgi:membrane dipeptidase
MVELVGADHVGLGLDYVWDIEEVKAYYRARPDLYPPDKGYGTPSQSISPERLPGLVQQMIDHGYPEDAIQKILGLNHLRVARSWL